MHEMSLVQGLIDQLVSLAAEHDKNKILTVTVDIGPLSGVAIDSFQFAFDILSKENSLTNGASLTIINSPATFRCVQCGYEESASVRPDQCLKCKESLLIPEGGDAITLNQVELE